MLKDWSKQFPRLGELTNELERIEAYEGWFASLPEKVYRSAISLDFFRQLESELSALHDDAWIVFKSKLVHQANSNRRELVSLFNEAAGYARLKAMLVENDIEYDAIYEPESSGRKPDWAASLRGEVVAAMEVKTVFNSDYQEAYIESNTQKLLSGILPSIRRLNPSIPIALLSKLDSGVANAKRQLLTVPGQPRLLVVFVIVNVDDEAAMTPGCRTEIEEYLHELSDEDISVVSDLRSPYL